MVFSQDRGIYPIKYIAIFPNEPHFFFLTLPSKRKAMRSVFFKPSLQESLLTCSNKVGLPKSITLWLMILILYISCTTASILIVLPQVNVDGNRVPVLFRGRPTYYRKFLVSTLLAFLGAFIALIIQDKPRVERFCRITAVGFMLSSLAIVSTPLLSLM